MDPITRLQKTEQLIKLIAAVLDGDGGLCRIKKHRLILV